MIFAAINWLNISIDLLLVVFVIVCLLMALLILMQRPKQEGLGAAFGGGVTDQVFGARTTNVLQKATVYLGSMFFLLSITLAILIGKQNEQKSLIEKDQKVAKTEAAANEETVVETVVVEPPDKSLSEELSEEENGSEPVEPTPDSTAPVDEGAPTEEVVPEVEGSPSEAAPAEGENEADKTE